MDLLLPKYWRSSIEPTEHIHSIVVFTGGAKFKTEIPQNVILIDDIIKHIKKHTEVVLSQNRMQFCIGRIESIRYQISRKTDIDHQIYLNNKYYQNKRV